jgi:peptidyl-prolyl cis-trans isomerase D
MVINQDKGLIVYAAEKKAPDLTEANPQYKTSVLQFARNTASRSGAEYLREITETELAKSAPAATP